MPEVDEIPKNVLCDVCAGCGMAIYSLEVAGEVTGRYIDYDEKRQGLIENIVYCGECWKAFKHNTDPTNIDEAVEKRSRLFNTNEFQ